MIDQTTNTLDVRRASSMSGRASSRIEPIAAAIRSLASACETICLSAGQRLGDAVPGLSDMAGQFNDLSKLLDNGAVDSAGDDLLRVSRDIAAIGHGLEHERAAVETLITLNRLLSRRISDVADDIRFLNAMVSSVKIELAGLQHEEGLEGFAQTLEQLASRAYQTIGHYQATQVTLLRQLMQTAETQSSFESSHHAKLLAVASTIETSLVTVTTRRKTIVGAAVEIGAATRDIGMRVGQSVVALQIGDSTRQRIEHADEALGVVSGSGPGDQGLETDDAAARVCRLQALQLTEASHEFSSEMETISGLLGTVVQSVAFLMKRGTSLFSSQGSPSHSLLGDLERTLETAKSLSEECRRSRAVVDGTAERIIATITEMEQLSAAVAATATDMTIIGTNAIVKSYRLGSRGAALSIISQHLRSHAIRVADGVKTLAPALKDVRDGVGVFAALRRSQDASAIGEIITTMDKASGVIREGGGALSAALSRLDDETGAISETLRQAIASLGGFRAVESGAHETVADLDDLADEIESDGDGSAIDAHLDSVLRPLYTMESERAIHDAFFADAA